MVYNLESRALVRHRMSKTLTSREVPSELFSEMVQLTAPSWGFRPLRFPPNQSSKQQHLRAVKQNWQKPFPHGHPWGRSRWKFLLRESNRISFLWTIFCIFPPDYQRLKHLLLGRKAMTNLDSVLKSRDITLLTKVCIVKSMVFPVVMYGCES